MGTSHDTRSAPKNFSLKRTVRKPKLNVEMRRLIAFTLPSLSLYNYSVVAVGSVWFLQWFYDLITRHPYHCMQEREKLRYIYRTSWSLGFHSPLSFLWVNPKIASTVDSDSEHVCSILVIFPYMGFTVRFQIWAFHWTKIFLSGVFYSIFRSIVVIFMGFFFFFVPLFLFLGCPR